MTFIQSLTDIVDRIEGCAGAVILGIDGIPIERYMPDLDPELDLDLVATELTTLLRHSMRVASDAELGGMREMLFNTDRQIFLLRPITEDYFLLLALNPGGNVGRARFELRKVQLALEAEFAI
ncbi:MAG TPA: roadblock/LC7 domain-containing protein [Blastocatellia bacterium]|nr:roadblock/LC7 domain-containing protein [Blastocatellia bacterium]